MWTFSITICASNVLKSDFEISIFFTAQGVNASIAKHRNQRFTGQWVYHLPGGLQRRRQDHFHGAVVWKIQVRYGWFHTRKLWFSDTIVWFILLCRVESFDLLEQLTTEAERLEWRSLGLSSDTLSMQNAVILFRSTVPPLILDPTGSIVDWLRKSLKNRVVEVLDQSDANFQSILEVAIRFGKALIVDVGDAVDPVLVPLLRSDLIKTGTRVQVEMGDKLVDYHASFSLFLTTRNASIILHPQTASVLNVVRKTFVAPF